MTDGSEVRVVSESAKRPEMVGDEPQHLRVLIANERRDRLELLAQVVAGLGHDVIAREIYVKEVGAATERERLFPHLKLCGSRLGEVRLPVGWIIHFFAGGQNNHE